VVVETPVNLTDDQKDMLKKFDASMKKSNRNHSPRESTWLDGVKRFFETISR
jgi:molecular chaperone DnaJ